jgi:uncharacterized membrane protein YphA (DoxX/SURF4 family)
MAVGTFGSWKVRAIIIARTLLATALLLSAFVGASHPSFNADIVFLSELSLGAVIAAGWRTRYAAVLVFLRTIAARVLAPDLQLVPLLADRATTTAVLIASGILVCFGHSTTQVGGALIDENNNSACEHSHTLLRRPWEEDLKVTIRLEDGHLRSPGKSRCIVTIHDRAGGVHNAGQEVWYAKDDR